MGCKLSISVIHPSKSPKPKNKKEIPDSPIFCDKKFDQHVASDEESYITVDAPDSERERV